MGRGIKASKNIVFDVTYEVYPKSGNSYIEEHEDYYVVGVGIDKLAQAEHDTVMADEVGYEIPVYLEKVYDETNPPNPTWNKNLVNGVFSGAIDKISSDEFDDLNLKAKWVQRLYKKEDTYSSESCPYMFTTFENNNVIFSWSMTDGGN